MNIIFRVARYLFRYRPLFGLTIGLAVLMAGLNLSIPLVIREVINRIVGAAEGAGLDLESAAAVALAGVGLMAALYFGRESLNSLRIRVNNILEQRVLIDLRRDLHAKLLDLPVAYYDQRKSGDVASRVTEDVQDVERALLDGTEQGTVAILNLVGITAVAFSLRPDLAAIMLWPAPILFVLAYFNSRRMRRDWRAVRDATGNLNSLLVENIQGNRLIQSFSLKDRESARVLGLANDLRFKTLRAMFRWSLYGPGTSFISSLSVVAVVGYGSYLLATDRGFDTGTLFAFFTLANMYTEPISRLNQLVQLLSQGKASGERVFEILDHPLEIESPAHPQPFPDGTIRVEYRDVQFSYAQRAAVLHRFNLVMEAGSSTALVGHTGAGKSTVANLLLRYYDVDGGGVTINGRDVREIGLEALRRNIGYVAQDPFLFDGTVAENMLLAREEATEAEIREALQGARALDFCDQLPNGIHTLIGERGIRLSMGEKQRLTIARVLLKNPPLVILDEATSSVDSITERLIQEALETLMSRRTSLIIAHRLSTVCRCDQIVVLDHGRIEEQGNHEQLMALDGHYARLWNTQLDVIPANA